MAGPLSLLPSHWSVPCFVDVDECSANNGGCEHTCQNQPGSFQCGCDIGHKLDEDRRSCICKCLVRAASGWAVGPSSAFCPCQDNAGWSSLALHLLFSSSFSAPEQWQCLTPALESFSRQDQSCFGLIHSTVQRIAGSSGTATQLAVMAPH